MNFWEFPKELHAELIESCLRKYGEVVDTIEGTFGTIYILDSGADAFPRYLIAKTPKVDSRDGPEVIRAKSKKLLYELNENSKYANHPLVSRFYDAFICWGMPVILTRRRERTLSDLIREGPISPGEAVSVTLQVAHALAYCAEHGLSSHQDLKPDNILVDGIAQYLDRPMPFRWLTRICDFGLANALSAFGTASGSRPYMAPEQYGAPEQLPRADVFAVGVILYELITGGWHPIGERTRDVWPSAPAEKGAKWGHEEVWKRWARSASKAIDLGLIVDPYLAVLISDCLISDAGVRESMDGLRRRLLTWLDTNEPEMLPSLLLMLRDFDQIAVDSEAAGWPYYEQLLAQINSRDW